MTPDQVTKIREWLNKCEKTRNTAQIILVSIVLCGCRYNDSIRSPYAMKKICVDGVSYLSTHSAADGQVLTLHVDKNGKPVECK